MEPGEGSLGVHIDVSHAAATPPGLTVTVDAECIAVEGRKPDLQGAARMTAIDLIGEGTSRARRRGLGQIQCARRRKGRTAPG